jgi:hypothetical protein
LLIDATAALDLYGGALSAAGALLRNAGDEVAQAAAGCRFSTAAELVQDELRRGADSLAGAAAKLRQAGEEAVVDDLPTLASTVTRMVPHVTASSEALEAAGAAILQRQSVTVVGNQLITAGKELNELSSILPAIIASDEQQQHEEAKESAERMQNAAQLMMEAGEALLPQKEGGAPTKATGKRWIKGGF